MPAIALAPLVALDGQPLPEAWRDALTELRVELQLQVPGQCSLRFSDPGYALLERHTISLGKSVKVSAPTDASLVLIAAEVTSIAVDQRAGEQPELVVVAHDKSHRLGRATNVKSFLSMTYSDVVTRLAADCGLVADVSSTSLTIDYLMQADSDLGLITELADRVGYDWWVEGDTLHFKAPASTGTVALALSETLLSFSARASGHRFDQVTVEGWDRHQQNLVTATATTPSAAVQAHSELATLAATPSSAFGQATLKTAGLGAHSQPEATQLSQAVLDRAGAAAVSAQGLASGNGHLKLGVTADVSQAGPLSGTYPVTRVEHLFRPRQGFLTRFHAGDRRPRTLVDTLSGARPSPTPATAHAGLTVGQVTNNNDNEKLGRVKVRYPGLSDQYETGWARVLGVGGGANRGTVFIPEVNDEVLIGFEGGDPRQPVVLGGLYGAKSTIPPPVIEGGKVQERGITSRLGHAVRLLDGDAPTAQAVVLELAGGKNKIHLGKDKLAITVPAGTPVEITAGSSTFSLASDGSASLSAPTVSIKGTQKISLSAPEIQLDATTQLSLQSEVMTSVKGNATLTLQSNGPLSANGKPVMIN